MTTQSTGRRRRAYLGPFHLNLIHFTSPWTAATWSAFMPGFGHLLLGQYLLGWILFIWEVVVNVGAHFNTAIVYSFTGRFQEASALLQDGLSKYLILTYGAVYAFTLFHSYKIAVDNNFLYELAHKENAPLAAFTIRQTEWNYLSKRHPLLGAVWSLLVPGIGAVYTHRVMTAVFELTWWFLILINSHVLPSLEYSAVGDFDKAVAVLDPEWTLFIPSMIGFQFHFTYVIVTERNKLFDKEQANYLVQTYQQNKQFPLHKKDGISAMRFIAAFNHSMYLEKAVTGLESLGIAREHIFASPLDRRNQKSVWFDTIELSDGKSLLDGVALLGALGCFFGTLYGFVLYWGPVIWGLIGFIGGALLGLAVKLLVVRMNGKRPEKVPKTEVVLIVDCEEDLARKAEDILWSNYAFGVSTIKNGV